MPKPPGRTALYRLFNAEGALLYVGIAVNPERRFTEHAWDKRWWQQVASKAVEWHETRREALAAEKAVIKGEGPRHNGVSDSLHPMRSVRFPDDGSWERALARAKTEGTTLTAVIKELLIAYVHDDSQTTPASAARDCGHSYPDRKARFGVWYCTKCGT